MASAASYASSSSSEKEEEEEEEDASGERRGEKPFTRVDKCRNGMGTFLSQSFEKREREREKRGEAS